MIMKQKIPAKVIFYGGTGQAKLNRPIVEHYGAKLVAVFDDTKGLTPPFADIPLYCGWTEFTRWAMEQSDLTTIGFCITIGNPHGRIRIQLAEKMKTMGLTPIPVIHPSAIIADNAVLGEGIQIMAGAIVQPEVKIGDHCIINSGAVLEHEVTLEDAVEIAPNATVLGLTHIGNNTSVGVGALILSRLKIGKDASIGAGVIITENIPDNAAALKRVI
jgi:sugar O-acyltransferase (sialic acid O-acetyltransferase NeuD family)